ncbi:helix-turn-helix domain-containing protein [Streptomyces sp. NPDC047002]|uniref:TetR/AcrR family transcriptional regulator n=1 Tax=Streptomyces sp. NPDC047002 TaxID=3155475 RepID=UPI00345549D3
MPKRETYHHGDLKAALVETALAVIAEQGMSAVSVADIARRAGVSSGAPYRHFPSRKALLTAAAVTAAHRLTAALHEARPAAGQDSDAVADSAEAIAVYTGFAAEHGSGFDLIFAEELQGAGDPELLAAGRGVMDALLPAALEITGGEARAALRLLERQIAAGHGYAALYRSGFLNRRGPTVEDIAGHAAAIARSLALDARPL